MQRIMLKSKIHNAVVTEANLSYMGSITIDGTIMDAADILENEQVQVVNLNNGVRFETYVIRGKEGAGIICLNGPAARLGVAGDRLHILSYQILDGEEAKQHKPVIIFLDQNNAIIREKKV
ncbi:MAG: aspartate 1-decarboxylase [Candidatus Latescibacter sp.]|nr:aspartate 1-decarboxylase [Candidatus Latescibacter sp.]